MGGDEREIDEKGKEMGERHDEKERGCEREGMMRRRGMRGRRKVYKW